jgi:hypothetical protein
MRAILAFVAVLAWCSCGEAAGHRFRVVNRCDAQPAFVVVNNVPACTYCTDCKCAAGACPGKCPVQPAAAVVPVAAPVYAAPVSSCPSGNCAAPVQSRGAFGFRRW